MPVLPMFPLGTVLLPGAVLPLHVFEPRYRRLVQDCLAGVPEFGVVLIERGSEVGGGDVRRDVATVARLAQVAELPDGRYAIVTVGARRVRIVHWLADDPYPRAEVEPLGSSVDELQLEEVTTGPAVDVRQAVVVARLRRVLAMATEAGYQTADATTEISTHPELASFQVAALAPVGEHDRYQLLEAASPHERFAMLDAMLTEAEAALQLELITPTDDDDFGR
jgi:Lon protease-like protein